MTVLGAACACGRTIFVQCPSVADILVAQQAMTGWGYDARGNTRCPDCLGGEAVVPPPTADGGEGQLSLRLEEASR